MKTNFKKLATAAGVTAALAGAGFPAHAIFVGDAGEAALVPLAVHVQSPGRYLNTVVKITVPKSVGNDVIPNYFTASHSSPTNGTALVPGNENPGAKALAVPDPTGFPDDSEIPTTSYIHWFWLNARSEKKADDRFPVSQDDTAVFDWAAVSQGGFANQAGYLVFVTETASQGAAADFSFFTDAYLVVGWDSAFNSKVGIPSLPLDDGQDTTNEPVLNNNVIEVDTSGGQVVRVSPLVTGNRTIWADGKPNSYVFDLSLARNTVEAGTIAVFWNDRNAAKWGTVPAYRFNNNEDRCSGDISLPNELNLVYIPPLEKAYKHEGFLAEQVEQPVSWFTGFEPPAGEDDLGGKKDRDVPGAWHKLGNDVLTDNICTTVLYDNDNRKGNKLPSIYGDTLGQWNYFNDAPLSGGFVKVVTPEPADAGSQGVEGASVAFTIPVFSATVRGWAGWPYFNSSALLAHPAGAFTQAIN